MVEEGQGGAVFNPQNVEPCASRDTSAIFPRRVYTHASLSMADGQPRAGFSPARPRCPRRSPATDLVAPLLEREGRTGMRVFLVGRLPGERRRRRPGDSARNRARPHRGRASEGRLVGLALVKRKNVMTLFFFYSFFSDEAIDRWESGTHLVTAVTALGAAQAELWIAAGRAG